jgi:hypothetical protein
MPDKNAMDRVERQTKTMLPDQLVAQLPDPETSFSTQRDDERVLLIEDLLR